MFSENNLSVFDPVGRYPSALRSSFWLGVVLSMLLLCVQQAQAQCPGTLTVYGNVAAAKSSGAMGSELINFAMGGCDWIVTGCGSAMLNSNAGPGGVCSGIVNCLTTNNATMAKLRINHQSLADNTSGNACIFYCPGGNTCRVQGGNALPVELLEFSVGETDDSRNEGSDN